MLEIKINEKYNKYQNHTHLIFHKSVLKGMLDIPKILIVIIKALLYLRVLFHISN